MSLSPRLDEQWAQFRSPFHSFMVIVIGTMSILLVGLLLSRVSKPPASLAQGGDT